MNSEIGEGVFVYILKDNSASLHNDSVLSQCQRKQLKVHALMLKSTEEKIDHHITTIQCSTRVHITRLLTSLQKHLYSLCVCVCEFACMWCVCVCVCVCCVCLCVRACMYVCVC